MINMYICADRECPLRPFATDALQSHSFFSHLSVLPKSSRNNFTLKNGTSIGPVIFTKTPFVAWSAGTYTLHSLINRSAKAAPRATVLRTSMYAWGCKSPLLWQMLDLLKIFESLSSDAAVWNELWIQSSGTRDKAATYFLEGLYPMCMKHTPVEPVAWCQCSLRNPTGNLTVARGWTWNGFKFVQLPNHQELLGWNHPNASIEPRKKNG